MLFKCDLWFAFWSVPFVYPLQMQASRFVSTSPSRNFSIRLSSAGYLEENVKTNTSDFTKRLRILKPNVSKNAFWIFLEDLHRKPCAGQILTCNRLVDAGFTTTIWTRLTTLNWEIGTNSTEHFHCRINHWIRLLCAFWDCGWSNHLCPRAVHSILRQKKGVAFIFQATLTSDCNKNLKKS